MAYSLKYSYDLASKTYSVTGYSNITESDKVVIPNKYNDGTNGEHPVTSIGSYAFNDCGSLTSIVISKGVTSIGVYAFAGCSNLNSINIQDGLMSIGEWAFGGCSNLTSVEIPDSVTSIDSFVFYNCSRLTSVILPEGIKKISTGLFVGCSSLTSITIPESVKIIGEKAFYNCHSLTSITIPDGVIIINKQAFDGCSSLTSVTIGDGVKSIGSSGFAHCSSLKTIILFPSTPPTLGSTNAIPSTISTIYVQQSSKEAYKAATNWNAFASKIESNDIYLSLIRFNKKNKEYITEKVSSSWNDFNLENGDAKGSLQQKYIVDKVDYSARAVGENAFAIGGKRYDYLTDASITPTSAEGKQSFAHGGSTHAYGDWSVTMGKDTKSYQMASTAFGGGSKAGKSVEEFNAHYWDSENEVPLNNGQGKDDNGNILDEKGCTYVESYSLAFAANELTKAYGRASFASGSWTESNGDASFTGGAGNVANGYASTAFGDQNHSYGDSTFSTGKYNKNYAKYCSALGEDLVSSGQNKAVVGRYNEYDEFAVFVVGVGGTSEEPGMPYQERKNGFTVQNDGRATVAKAPVYEDDVCRLKELNQKLTTPTTPVEDSAVILEADGTVSTKALNEFAVSVLTQEQLDSLF